MQFGAGLLAWLGLHRLPRAGARLRYSFWLYMVFNLLISSGYVAFSGVIDFGDAAVIIASLRAHIVWRGVLTFFGAVVYFLSMRGTALEFKRFAGLDDGSRLYVPPRLDSACHGRRFCVLRGCNEPNHGTRHSDWIGSGIILRKRPGYVVAAGCAARDGVERTGTEVSISAGALRGPSPRPSSLWFFYFYRPWTELIVSTASGTQRVTETNGTC